MPLEKICKDCKHTLESHEIKGGEEGPFVLVCKECLSLGKWPLGCGASA